MGEAAGHPGAGAGWAWWAAAATADAAIRACQTPWSPAASTPATPAFGATAAWGWATRTSAPARAREEDTFRASADLGDDAAPDQVPARFHELQDLHDRLLTALRRPAFQQEGPGWRRVPR